MRGSSPATRSSACSSPTAFVATSSAPPWPAAEVARRGCAVKSPSRTLRTRRPPAASIASALCVRARSVTSVPLRASAAARKPPTPPGPSTTTPTVALACFGLTVRVPAAGMATFSRIMDEEAMTGRHGRQVVSTSVSEYDASRAAYTATRRADPRIAAAIERALGDARTVLNVGAGAGSYESPERDVTAVEPSPTMRAQRPPGAPEAIDARAEDLPFDNDSFDAAMAILTVHHWSDQAKGLRELRRVARGPVVVLTFDPHEPDAFW